MNLFLFTLFSSTFLCSLVAGFLFAFAVIIMPGIKRLSDKNYIYTFQVIDRVIQNNHPLFLLVWVGSLLSIISCTIFSLGEIKGLDFFIMLTASTLYIIGVQITTIIIHLPLNNKLQRLDIESLSPTELKYEREKFDDKWNKYNILRAFVACFVSFLLIFLTLSQ